MNYDKAHELAAQIKASEEFKTYSVLKDELYANEQTKGMIKEFKKLQFEAQAAYMAGKQPEPAVLEKAQKMGEVLQFNPRVTEFFAAEYRMNTILSDIYKIIGESCDFGVDLFEA